MAEESEVIPETNDNSSPSNQVLDENREVIVQYVRKVKEHRDLEQKLKQRI